MRLANRNFPSTVVEKQKAIPPSKWVILLYPQGMKIFDELGVLEDMMKLGLSKPPEQVVEGGTILVFDVGLLFEEHYNHYLVLGPSEIRQVLRKHALENGVEILEGVTCKGLVRDSNNKKIVGAEVSGHDGNNNGYAHNSYKIESKVLVCAEGYRSLLRDKFGVRTKITQYDSLNTSFYIDYPGHGSSIVALTKRDGMPLSI